MANLLKLSKVVQITGLKPESLRAWERRYGFPNPIRSDGKQRLYSINEVHNLLWLKKKIAEGYPVSRAIELLRETYLPKLSSRDILSTATEKLVVEAVEASYSYNPLALENVIDNGKLLLEDDDFIENFITRFINTLNIAWVNGQFVSQQLIFTSEILVRKINAYNDQITVLPQATGSLLLCTPEGEFHALANLLLEYHLKKKGYNVFNLGAGIPEEQLNEALEKLKPRFVVISGQSLHSAVLIKVIANICAANDITGLFAGGIFVENPALIPTINGIYLGDTITAATEKITIYLTDEATIPRKTSNFVMVKKNGRDVERLRERKYALINRIISAIDRRNPFASYMRQASELFINDLISSVELGDPTFVKINLHWIGTLLERRGVSLQNLIFFLDLVKEVLHQEAFEEYVSIISESQQDIVNSAHSV